MRVRDTLVCGIGGDDQAERLVRAARRLAQATGLRPRFVHVVEALPALQAPAPFAVADDNVTRRPDVEVMWHARSLLRHSGAHSAEMVVEMGDPATELARSAEREGAAMIMVASRGFGPLKSVLFGSVSRSLMEDAVVPVMVLPPDVEPAFDSKHLLCAARPGGTAAALAPACDELAELLGRDLVVAHVHEDETASAWPSGNGSAPESAADSAVATVRLSGGDVIEQLERVTADLSADIVVVGPPESELLGGVVRRSVTVELARRAPHVVVVVPRKRLESAETT